MSIIAEAFLVKQLANLITPEFYANHKIALNELAEEILYQQKDAYYAVYTSEVCYANN